MQDQDPKLRTQERCVARVNIRAHQAARVLLKRLMMHASELLPAEIKQHTSNGFTPGH